MSLHSLKHFVARWEVNRDASKVSWQIGHFCCRGITGVSKGNCVSRKLGMIGSFRIIWYTGHAFGKLFSLKKSIIYSNNNLLINTSQILSICDIACSTLCFFQLTKSIFFGFFSFKYKKFTIFNNGTFSFSKKILKSYLRIRIIITTFCIM